jgi:hypothetical protein
MNVCLFALNESRGYRTSLKERYGALLRKYFLFAYLFARVGHSALWPLLTPTRPNEERDRRTFVDLVLTHRNE